MNSADIRRMNAMGIKWSGSDEEAISLLLDTLEGAFESFSRHRDIVSCAKAVAQDEGDSPNLSLLRTMIRATYHEKKETRGSAGSNS